MLVGVLESEGRSWRAGELRRYAAQDSGLIRESALIVVCGAERLKLNT